MIYLDSCILIYAIEQHPKYVETVHQAIATTDSEFVVSPLVKMECLVKPLMSGNNEIKKRYEAAFELLMTLSMPEEVYSDATLLRARFRLKTPDALHLSCAQYHNCSALWTNDNRLAKGGHGLPVNVLSG